MTAAEIAAALEMAVEDGMVECEVQISGQAVGNALGRLLRRQEQGEPCLGILMRKTNGQQRWRIAPKDRASQERTDLSDKLSAGMHK